MKRKWPDFNLLNNINLSTQELFEKWLEENLTEKELDRVAPIECEHERVVGELEINYASNYSKHKINVFQCVGCKQYLKSKGWEVAE